MTEATVTNLPPTAPIPAFEGRVVDQVAIRIAGSMPTDGLPENLIVSVDDRVRLVGEYKVVGVRHYVDPRTGDLVREQMLKPILVDTIPWDASDPKDDGVIRVL